MCEDKKTAGDGVWAVDDLVEPTGRSQDKRPVEPPHVEARRHVDGCGFDD
jgi:hypothetical protein